MAKGFSRSNTEELASQVESSIKNKKTKRETEKEQEIITEDRLISTGSTLLNLALSDTANGGYVLGKIAHMPGDSQAGKSLLALTLMAECCRNPKLDDYHLIIDDTEAAYLFPLDRFGKKLKDRLIFLPKEKDRGKPRTIEAWAADILQLPGPFIHITDSWDGVTSEEDLKKISKKKKKTDDEEDDGAILDISGGKGYKTGKAKASSEFFRLVVQKVEESRSFMLFTSQTKQSFDMFGPDKTFSGGNAIIFYRSHEVWADRGGKITKDIKGVKTKIGAYTRLRVEKNRLTGKERTIEVPVYRQIGVDDIGSCVDWLLKYKFWTKTENGLIKTGGDFGFEDGARREKVISTIEGEKLKPELRQIMQESWLEVEKELCIDRKCEYEDD